MENSEPRKGLNLHLYPSTLVSASRIGRLARSLQSTRLFTETHAVGIQTGELPAIEVLAPQVKIVRILGSARTGTLGRILKVILWQPRVYREYSDKSVSVVAAHNVWVLPLAYRLSRTTHAILAYNAHELETETINIKGLKQRIAKLIERRYIGRAQIVSVVNESIADWYEANYPIDRPVVATNTPADDGSSADLRSELGVSAESMLYIHTGNLVEGRSIPLILNEFASNTDVHVVFLGDGHLRSIVQSASSRHHNIHWLPPVPPDSVVSYTRGADAGLCLIQHVSLSDKLSTPNKLMEPLFAGIPVISSSLPEARRLLGAHAESWVLGSPEEELHSALRRLGKSDVRAFQKDWRGMPSWETQVKELAAMYREAVNNLS